MVDTVYEPKVDMHKVKRYTIDPWQMITFWDYQQYFHVVIRRANNMDDADMIHLTVEAQSGRRSEFKAQVIWAALRAAAAIKDMDESVVTCLFTATGYQQ